MIAQLFTAGRIAAVAAVLAIFGVWLDATAQERGKAAGLSQAVLDAEPGPWQVPYAPQDGAKVQVDPPVLVWVPVKGAPRYVVQLARSEGDNDETLTDRSKISVYARRAPLGPGKWKWRYGLETTEGQPPRFSRWRAFEVPVDAVKIPFPDVGELVRRLSGMRPRIGIQAAALESVREQARSEMRWAVDEVLRRAERSIGQPLLPEPARLPPPNDPQRGLIYTKTFRTVRPFMAGMNVCAEAYLLTGDERFGREARRRLLHIMAWDPNGSTSLDHNDEPGTEIVRDAPRVYDYTYPLLSEEDRALCRRVLAIRIPQVYEALRRRPFESNPFESHAMGYYVPDLIQACLAMAGDLPVEEMLEYALLQVWSPFYPPYGGEDGGWSEGPPYWGWSTSVFAATFLFVEQATGMPISQRPWLKNTPFYKLYGNPPYSKMSPFGDGQSSPSGSPDTMYYLGALLRNPYALWHAEHAGFKPSGIAAFLFQPGDLKPRAPDDLPQARLFADVGLAAMHSALADGPRNVQVVLRSSPYGSTSHAYADQNAFVLHAFGEPLAIASGYYDYYASPHHRNWTWQTKAANCITVNGEGQQTRSREAKGRIARFATNAYAHYAQGDARLAYPGRLDRFDRHVVFLRPAAGDEAMVVMFDDLQSRQTAHFQWWLHSLEPMQTVERDDVAERSAMATLRRGAARLQVRFLLPGSVHFEQTEGFPVAPVERYPPQWHLAAATDSPATQQQFLTVLLPYREGGEARLPSVRLVEGRGCRCVEIRSAGARHVVLFRQGDQPGSMEAAGAISSANVLAAGFDPQGRTLGRLEE